MIRSHCAGSVRKAFVCIAFAFLVATVHVASFGDGSSTLLSNRAPHQDLPMTDLQSTPEPMQDSVSVIGKNDLYLMNSPLRLMQVAGSAAVLQMMKPLVRNTGMLSSTSKAYNLLVLPMLSSACCTLQLAINALTSLGCAGFNKVLGPVRPIFLAILLHNTARMTKTAMALSWIVALSPELVHLRNQKIQYNDETMTMAPASSMVEIRLAVPGMGCSACVNKVTSALKMDVDGTQHDIQHASSWLSDQGGEAMVRIPADGSVDTNAVAEGIQKNVQQAGDRKSVV